MNSKYFFVSLLVLGDFIQSSIILLGFKGVGKSTLGAAFAKAYALDFVDTDQLILEDYAQSTGAVLPSIKALYQALGAADFRALESRIIQDLAFKNPTVVATGGGVLDQPSNGALLKSLGLCVHLKLELEQLYQRLASLDSFPPALLDTSDYAAFKALYEQRKAQYKTISEVELDLSGQNLETSVLSLKRFIDGIQ